jgi:cyclophilin family peptidyl-prolyl cis-trans isomerase
MPSAKRERQRANREMGRQEAHAARRSARRKRSATFTTVLVGGLVAVALLLAFLVSRGDDDDVVETESSLTTAAAATTALDTTATARTIGDAAVDGITCDDVVPTAPDPRPTFSAAPEQTIDTTHTYVATLDTSCGAIEITLDVADAPITSNNFVTLARAGFYTATIFHRAVPDFVIQGGDPEGTGAGGPGYEFADENITEPYQQGSVAMANSGPNTNGSQFFICTGTQANCGLTQAYNNFGSVTKGLEVARKIEAFSASDGPPSRTIFLKSVTITETDASGTVVPEPTTTTTAAATTTPATTAAGDTTATTIASTTTTSAATTTTAG